MYVGVRFDVAGHVDIEFDWQTSSEREEMFCGNIALRLAEIAQKLHRIQT